MKWLLTLFICFLSIIGTGQNEHLQMLQNAPIIENLHCDKEGTIISTFCPYYPKDSVFYRHESEAPIHDFLSVKYDIDTTLVGLYDLADMVLVEDTTTSFNDLVIKYRYLDGKGGTLAKASLPNCSPDQQYYIIYDNYDLPAGKNAPDSIKPYYRNTHVPTITLHEGLHNLESYHINSSTPSIMNPYYIGPAGLTRLDSLQVQIKFSKNSHIMIHKDSTNYISPNFRENEFFTKCQTELEWILLHKDVLNLVQTIRTEYDSPIKITSTKRDWKCNKVAKGKDTSRHLFGLAIDFKFYNESVQNRFRRDIVKKGVFYQRLLRYGLKGIVLYDNHIHIDVGEHSSFIQDNSGSYIESECSH